MSARRLWAIVLVMLVAAVAIPASPTRAASREGISVTVDRTRISVKLGRKFVFRSTVTNRGTAAARSLIAHLNVLSLRKGVYVDPEDWSSNRTRYLGDLAPGRSATTTWHIQAVNDGDFGIYVAVLSASGAAVPPTGGPAIHLAVAQRTTLNARGILPLAVAVPALLGFLALGFGLRRRAQTLPKQAPRSSRL